MKLRAVTRLPRRAAATTEDFMARLRSRAGREQLGQVTEQESESENERKRRVMSLGVWEKTARPRMAGSQPDIYALDNSSLP